MLSIASVPSAKTTKKLKNNCWLKVRSNSKMKMGLFLNLKFFEFKKILFYTYIYLLGMLVWGLILNIRDIIISSFGGFSFFWDESDVIYPKLLYTLAYIPRVSYRVFTHASLRKYCL